MAAVVFSYGDSDESSDLKISTWGWYTFGTFVSGYSQYGVSAEADIDLTGYWIHNIAGGIKVIKNVNDDLRLRVHIATASGTRAQDMRESKKEYLQRKFGVALLDAAIERTATVGFGDSKVLFEFGFLPVKYNHEALNLGEYLFERSTPYPAVVESGFELADKAKLMGFHFGYTKPMDESELRADGYVSLETKMWPMGDISLAALGAFNIRKVFEVGLGLNFHHLLSVDKRQTTPGKDAGRLGFPLKHLYVDTLTGDTTLYTGRGIKAMARFTLNPRALIPGEALGKEDLKLFSEIAILGLRNYPGWYENIGERIPIMFGFNIPTFKLLDVMSLQFQWFGSKYWNTWENMMKDGCFVPYVGRAPGTIDYDAEWGSEKDLPDSLQNLHRVTEDNWKWSLYMSRKINNRVRLSFQFANDNTFKTGYVPPPPAPSKYTEVTRQTWATDENGKEKWGQIFDWYWTGRVTFYF